MNFLLIGKFSEGIGSLTRSLEEDEICAPSGNMWLAALHCNKAAALLGEPI